MCHPTGMERHPTSPAPHIIYLHGFASGPRSNKADQFARALRDRRLEVSVPDLNEDDFKGLTISRQLRLVKRLAASVRTSRLIMIGSSMGAYVAALFAGRDPRVDALVLMAPAFDFSGRWAKKLSPGAFDFWHRQGSIQVMHYGTNRMEPIGWGLIEDGARHPPLPEVTAPTLIFHGRADESVSCDTSIQFSRGRANVALELLDDDHSLASAVPYMISRTMEFLRPWIPGADSGT